MKSLKILTLSLVFILGLSYSQQSPKAIDTGDVLAGAAAVAAIGTMYTAMSSVATPSIGGYITWISPCTNPPAINFVTLQPQPPFIGTGAWMFLPGSIPFAYSPPAHPGQPILGRAILGYVPCLTGPVITGPGGLPVLYTGTGV